MAQTKRISGNYTIDPTGTFSVLANTTITGDLTVTGTQTTISSTDLAIKDRMIVLNQGETGAGITGTYAGIEVERGSATNVVLRFNETTDTWQFTNNGSTYGDILSTKLTGDLDTNGYNLTSGTSNQDINLIPNGTGRVGIEGALKLNDQGSAPASATGATLLYAGTAGGGGSGVFFVDGSTSDELVSKSKAIVYGLIF